MIKVKHLKSGPLDRNHISIDLIIKESIQITTYFPLRSTLWTCLFTFSTHELKLCHAYVVILTLFLASTFLPEAVLTRASCFCSQNLCAYLTWKTFQQKFSRKQVSRTASDIMLFQWNLLLFSFFFRL